MTNCDSEKCRAGNFLARHSFWVGLILVAVAFSVGLMLSWQKWCDLFVDYGVQLYIPWRLMNGAVLYRDLFYFAGGPLSQYFNALLFKIFGASILTLVSFNIFLSLALLTLVYRRFFSAADFWTAFIVGLGIVFGFAFSGSNSNYLTPYSHEALDGLVLSAFAVAFFADWLNKRQLRFVFAAGFCAGLVLLTKPDIFVALIFCAFVAAMLFLLGGKKNRFALQSLAAFVAAGILPPLFFFVYFLGKESWRESLRSTFFGFVPLRTVVNNPLYQWSLGFEAPTAHLRQMAIHFLFIVAVIAGYAFLLRHLDEVRKRWPHLRWLPAVLWSFPLIIWLNLITGGALHVGNCAASFPLLTLCACILACRHYKSDSGAATFPLLWNFFALGLLSKMGFHSRIWQYGFVLAMPAFVAIAYSLMWSLPKILDEKFKVPVIPLRAMTFLVLLIGTATLFIRSINKFDEKFFPVAAGGDRILTTTNVPGAYAASDGNSAEQQISVSKPGVSEGESMNEALGWIQKNVPTNGTVAVLPHGATINYLSRRVNPTPCLFWDPNVMSVFGETTMTSDFEKNAPDYIFIVEWYEYRTGYLGDDYAKELMRWIYKNYQPVRLIGNEPLKNGAFGIKILKHISQGAVTNQIYPAGKI